MQELLCLHEIWARISLACLELCCWAFAKHVALAVTLKEALTGAKKMQLSKSSYLLFLLIYHL